MSKWKLSEMRKAVVESLIAWLVIALTLLMLSSCNKKLTSTQTEVTTLEVRDCTIVIPADTAALFLLWSELCDTTAHVDTVYLSQSKSGRIKQKVQRTQSGFIFTCKEDSLVQVIKGLQKIINTKTNVVESVAPRNTNWMRFSWALLLLAIAAVLFAIQSIAKRYF